MTTATATTQRQATAVTSTKPTHTRIARWWWAFRVLARFVVGYARYLRTGSNTPEAYADMRRLFRMSGGRFNDVFAAVNRLLRRPYRITARESILGHGSANRIDDAGKTIRQQGAHIFGQVLSKEDCAELVRLAESAPCRPIPKPGGCDPYVFYDPKHWIAPRYAFDESAILAHPVVQRLAADQSMLSVAQRYLGAKPVLSSCVMWWSTAMLDHASTEAAQLYHFDMSHIRFIKFFFYLTDVGPDNGPHTYLLGSHHRLHPSLSQDRRFTDDEVFALYAKDRALQITGPAGTMFAADTRGLHKGMPLRRGHRLVLEFQFATCHFGDSPGRVTIENPCPQLRAAASRYRYTFNRFDLPE